MSKPITITELTRYLKRKFDDDSNLANVYLKGEISNFKAHSRGHLYFSLKDDTSKINAIMFSFNASKLKFVPKEGSNVLVTGKISVYEATGNYQIYVESMIEDGIGNLYLEYEKLKAKLSSEGLFDPLNKKELPKYPKKIGVITAPTGAAIKDILSTIRRRYPVCETILFPTLVQGDGAKENIVRQIETANEYDIDVIILGRGGGSIEDLWAFNEECVARAIYASKIPIISAVGHEVDFTISDFVSDFRAPTPTGAAEMAVPSLKDILLYLEQLKLRASNNIRNYLDNNLNKLISLQNSYVLKNPLAIYEVKEQKLSNYIDVLNNIITNMLNNKKKAYEKIIYSHVIRYPKMIYQDKEVSFQNLLNKLNLLNPLSVLEKGYSVISKENKIIKDIKSIKVNDEIDIKLYKGNIKANVISKGE